MTIFSENKEVLVYCWNLGNCIFTGSKPYNAEAGFGLPNGMTIDEVIPAPGKVAVRNIKSGHWDYLDDDRGRVFYDKQNGSIYRTTLLGEKVCRRSFTKVPLPNIENGELVRFDDSQQKWLVGLDWYEKPIWDNNQIKSFCTDDFFVANSIHTNIAPAPKQEGWVLNSTGTWVEPSAQQLDDYAYTK